MKEKYIRVVSLQPAAKPVVIELENTLKAMQAFVDGLIECIPLTDPDADIVLIANDEAKLCGMMPNRWLWGGLDLLMGPAFIAAGDADGNLCSLTDEQIDTYCAQFRDPILIEA